MFLKNLVSNIIKGGKLVLAYATGISALTPTDKDDRAGQYAGLRSPRLRI